MRTEDYLQTASDIKFRIDELEKERNDIRINMISIKSSTDYQERVQSSPRKDDLENRVIRIIEKMERLDRELIKEREKLIGRRHNIIKKIPVGLLY